MGGGRWISYNVSGAVGCTNVAPKSLSHVHGLGSSNYLRVRKYTYCWADLLVAGTMYNLDTNKDCRVDVYCHGNYKCSSQ